MSRIILNNMVYLFVYIGAIFGNKSVAMTTNTFHSFLIPKNYPVRCLDVITLNKVILNNLFY